MTAKKKPYISPSQAIMYTKCGEQYRRRYVLGEIIPPGIALIKGTSVHKGAEFNFSQKILSEKDRPAKDVVDYAVNIFDETVKHEGLLLNSDEESRGKSVVVGEAKDRAALLSEALMTTVAPKYQPAEVEAERFIDLPESTHNLKGIIDLKTREGNIVELKTSARAWVPERVERDLQLTFYGLMERAKTGAAIKPLILENIVDTKIPKVVSYISTREDGDYQNLINRLNRIIDGINKGVFPAAHPDSYYCSPKFCGYWDSCSLRPRK